MTTKANFQNQQVSIKNLEQYVGQIATALSYRTQGTLPSNIETNPKEHVKAITIRSGVQFPEVYMKQSTTTSIKIPITSDEHVD